MPQLFDMYWEQPLNWSVRAGMFISSTLLPKLESKGLRSSHPSPLIPDTNLSLVVSGYLIYTAISSAPTIGKGPFKCTLKNKATFVVTAVAGSN